MTSTAASFRRILVLALALIAVAPAAAQACTGADADPETVSAAATKKAVLCLVNEQRAGQRLAPLKPNRKLSRSARAYARQMVSAGFFSHTGLKGEAPAARIAAAGYLKGRPGKWTLGENLAYGVHGVDETPRQTVTRWMNSPAHRAVILHTAFTSLGVGLAAGTPGGGHGTTYVTHYGN